MAALKEEELLEEIDILPLELKTKIVERLLESITPTNSAVDALWIQEVEKRRSEVENSPDILVDGDEVFQKIAKRLQL